MSPSRSTVLAITAALSVFLACVAAAEQIGAAWQIALSVRETSGATVDAAKLAPPDGWSIGTGALGAGSGLVLILLGREVARADRYAGRFELPALVALGLWVIWIALGPVLGRLDEPPTWPLAIAHWGAAGLAVASIALLAHAFLDDLAAAWDRVAVIRLQLLLLVALIVIVVFAPLTSDQMTDVLRAWTDGPCNRALAGIAAALLLGAVARTSILRLLRAAPAFGPLPRPPERGAWRLVVVLAALGAAVALGFLHAPIGMGVAIALAVLAAVTRGTNPLRVRQSRGRELKPAQVAGVAAVLPVAMLYGGLVTAAVQSFLVGEQAWTLAALALGTGVLFAIGGVLVAAEPEPSRPRPWRTAWWAALAVPCVLVLLVIPSDDPDNGYAFVAVPLLLFAALVALRATIVESEAALWAGGGAAVGAIAVIYADPIAGADALGTFALVMLAATGVLVLLHLAGAAAMRNTPLGGLGKHWFVPSRVPVVALLALWVVAATFWPVDTAHRARVVSTTEATAPASTPGTPVTLDAAVRTWLGRFGEHPPDYLPMLLVAASGGGSKAAYWTDLVLDCLLSDGTASGDECATPSGKRPERRRAIALTSSVSGGSVGVYHYLVHPEGAGGAKAWIAGSAGREVLSPVTGWAAFHDAPAFLLGLERDPTECTSRRLCRRHADRALVQEAAVADYGHDIVPPHDVQALATPRTDAPIPIFNGTINGGGGRVLMSPVDLAALRPAGCEQRAEKGRPVAGAVDAYDYLGKESDLPLATAALLSARFPVVAPPGRLGESEAKTQDRHCAADAPLPPIDVRDGGYMENTGLLTITELLPAIQAAIRGWSHPRTTVQIIVLSIDDDPAVLTADPRLRDPGVAPLSITQRAGPGYLSQLARDRLTSCQYPSIAYRRISPEPHGGAHAATGWEVSSTTRQRDLAGALDGHDDKAYQALDEVRTMLDGEAPAPRCGPTPGSVVRPQPKPGPAKLPKPAQSAQAPGVSSPQRPARAPSRTP